MSRDGSISFEWGDGEHRFCMAVKQWEELQEKTGHGPEEVFYRLRDKTWFVAEIVETIRIGLIGGGMDAAKARTLVQRYVGPGNLMKNIEPAMIIISEGLNGASDEAPKKALGEVEKAHPSPTVNGASLASTEMAP